MYLNKYTKFELNIYKFFLFSKITLYLERQSRDPLNFLSIRIYIYIHIHT